MGSSNRLDDRVKKNERNGYQMRKREERTVNKGVFVGSSNFVSIGSVSARTNMACECC